MSRASPPAVKPQLYRHPHGVYAVDAEYLYPGHAAAHLIVDAGRAAFVDVGTNFSVPSLLGARRGLGTTRGRAAFLAVGTNFSVPYLLAALRELGIAREQVDYLLLTHVHLDHAGGAGRLMQQLPNAVAVLHPRG